MNKRAVFFGTPEIAVPALRVLSESCEVTLVVTQPDRPAGRGRKLRAPPVKEAARELGLPVWQPEVLRKMSIDQLDPRLLDVDLFVVMAYGELLRQAILDLPTDDCINLHASILPRWRGASPLQAVLRAGEAKTGVSVMSMVAALDAGPVYHIEELAIPDHWGLPQLHDELGLCAARGLKYFIDQRDQLTATPQDESAVTWCGKLGPSDGFLDPDQPIEQLLLQLRAYTPIPGCSMIEGSDGSKASGGSARFRIWQAQAYSSPRPAGENGQIMVIDEQVLLLVADGALVLEVWQAPGKRRMTLAEYQRGNQLPQRLACPAS